MLVTVNRFMSKGILTDFIEMNKQHPVLWNTKSKSIVKRIRIIRHTKL
jgi:hypothetical protein